MRRISFYSYFCLLGALFLAASRAIGSTHELPKSLAVAVLTETTPFVFEPSDFDTGDFEVEWEGRPLPGIEAQLVPGSLVWVRVHEVFVIPRAQLRIHTAKKITGFAVHQGSRTPFHPEGGGSTAILPVALLSGPENSISLQLAGESGPQEASYVLRFHHRGESKNRLLIDNSCSTHGLMKSEATLSNESWAFVGCRLVWMKTDEGFLPSLELFVLWDNVGQEIEIDGKKTHSTADSVWPLRMGASPGFVNLKAGEQKLALKYAVPKKLPIGFMGIGIGPYNYISEPTGDLLRGRLEAVTPVATLYGSLFLAEYFRMVMFSAIPIHSRLFADTGVYLLVEQSRLIDNRFSFNLLLGGHFLTYKYNNEVIVRPSFPQGFEVIFRDFPFRADYVSAGAFLYPLIQGRSYSNVWARWGRKSFFAEFNYISWQEQTSRGSIKSSVIGACVGFPLFRFF